MSSQESKPLTDEVEGLLRQGKSKIAGGNPPAKKIVYQKELPPKIKTLISRLIGTCAFFSNMEAEEVEAFLRQCKSEVAEEGEIIFHKGEEGNDMYIIVSGKVVVLSGGDEKRNLRLGKGDVFGEIAVIEGIPRSASIRAEEISSLLTVSRSILEIKAPILKAKVLANVAHQIAIALLKANEEVDYLLGEVKRFSAGDIPPPAGDTTPLAGDTTPLAGDTTPLAGDTTPLAGGTTPLAGGTTPLAGDTTPSWAKVKVPHKRRRK